MTCEWCNRKAECAIPLILCNEHARLYFNLLVCYGSSLVRDELILEVIEPYKYQREEKKPDNIEDLFRDVANIIWKKKSK